MDRCSNYSHENSLGPCSCGYFQGVTSPGSAFSILFAMPNKPATEEADFNHLSSSSSSYSSVDCTLSLGTPSTRQTNDNSVMHQRHPSMSNLCWDIFQSKQPTGSHKTGRGSSSSSSNMGGDSLLARRCANCDTTSTPLWRNGPRGPKSLCNACGIRYKKEERRATATTPMEPQHLISHHHHHHTPWNYSAQPQKSPYVEDEDGESDGGVSFLSWRLNVPVRDRQSLVHHLT